MIKEIKEYLANATEDLKRAKALQNVGPSIDYLVDIDKTLPEIGKTYYAYDDGKVTTSRQFKVIVKEIIPWDKASK